MVKATMMMNREMLDEGKTKATDCASPSVVWRGNLASTEGQFDSL